ncbi:hypothetical protein LC593_21755 [Nostoc sp. CHAB 5844]|nr:hypothetical protein [Nostoc sp. CHAB 5844]
MQTENITSSKNTESTIQQENKQELNQKTAVQFSLSIALGVITIILGAATAYYGLIRF